MADPATLQAWLASVEQAIQDLAMGSKTASVGYDGKTVTYTPTDMPTLRARKIELEVQLGLSQRRALRPFF